MRGKRFPASGGHEPGTTDNTNDGDGLEFGGSRTAVVANNF
jgi:hypothetical protein